MHRMARHIMHVFPETSKIPVVIKSELQYHFYLSEFKFNDIIYLNEEKYVDK